MIILLNIFLFNFFIFLPRNNIELIYHGSRQENKIAITFDACPSIIRGGFDKDIVNTLIDSGVPATFFLSGKWIQKHKQEVKFLNSIPFFEIGNHSYTHANLCRLSIDSIKQELILTEKLIKEITGTSIKLFRPPYGKINNNITQTAHSLGFTTVMYDVVSGDPDSTITPDALINYVNSRTSNGSIIIMHVNGRGWHTAKALPNIFHYLKKKGFIFVRVSELINRLEKKF